MVAAFEMGVYQMYWLEFRSRSFVPFRVAVVIDYRLETWHVRGGK